MSYSDSHIPDDMADAILAEASRLYSEANGGYSRENLQEACSEVGISASIFQKAVRRVEAKRDRRPMQSNYRRLEPVKLDSQTICWSVQSGKAVGVQTCTKTHTTFMSTGFSVVPLHTTETVIKLFIKREHGARHPLVLRNSASKIRVREGQRVSALWGHIGGKASGWLIFINHSDRTWHWVSSPQYFFKSLALFQPLSGWWLFFFLGLLIAALCLPSTLFFWPLFLKLSGIYVGIIESTFCVCVFTIQRIRAQLAWRFLELRIAEMVGQLMAEEVL